MKSHKPDRWEREIEKLPNDSECGLWKSEVLGLLRKQHRWVQRTVKRLPLYTATATEFKEGYTMACNDILAKLKERAK